MLITSELTDQSARKTLFTCVVYTNTVYFCDKRAKIQLEGDRSVTSFPRHLPINVMLLCCTDQIVSPPAIKLNHDAAKIERGIILIGSLCGPDFAIRSNEKEHCKTQNDPSINPSMKVSHHDCSPQITEKASKKCK